MKNPFLIPKNDFEIKNFVIKKYTQTSEEGDAWWFTTNSRGGSLKLAINKKKINIFFILLSLVFFVLISWLFYLQIIRGKFYKEIAEGNRIRIKVIKAARGYIYDRNRRLLAQNIPNFSLAIIPADLPRDKQELDKTFATIIEILHSLGESISKENLEDLLNKSFFHSYEPVIIKEHIPYEKAILISIKSSNLPGVTIEIQSSRNYLEGQLMAHTLGYIGKITKEELKINQNQNYLFNDYIGKTGIEFKYEQVLRGIDGKKRVEVNSMGIEKRIIGIQPPKTGNSIILSLDAELQKKVSSILRNALKKSNSTKGTVIVIDPRNGEVLALVSFPEFDNNLFVKGISFKDYQKLINNPNKPLFLRAISGEYPSGSTIKPIIAAAALEEGIINRNTVFNSTGGIKIKKWFFPDWKAKGHGLTNVTKAIAESVNTFFYIIGGGLFNSNGNYEIFKGLGVKKIREYAKLFGLSELSGIDLPNEKPGFLPTPEWKKEVKKERWYVGDTYHLSIGQGDILVTPLQVANFTAAIANRGTLYKPHLVKEIINPEGNTVEIIEPTVIRSNFIDSNNLEIVRLGLRETVTKGSARSLLTLPVKVAGKTGTAQVGGKKKPHAWFTCFAPYENPEIVITVLVENGGEGSTIATPIAYKILKWYFSLD